MSVTQTKWKGAWFAVLCSKFSKTKPLNLGGKCKSVLMLLLAWLLWSYLLKNAKVETGLKSLEQLMLEAGELELDHAWRNLSRSCFFFCCWPTVCGGWGDGVGEQGLGKALERLCENNYLGFGSTHQVWKDQLGTISIIQEFISEKKMGNWCMQLMDLKRIPAPIKCLSPTGGEERGKQCCGVPAMGGPRALGTFRGGLAGTAVSAFLYFTLPKSLFSLFLFIFTSTSVS